MSLLILIHSERISNSCLASCVNLFMSLDGTVTLVSSAKMLAFEY